MPWRQLEWECEERVADAATEWLETRGAVSVTLEDAADVPLYEPAPGQTPMWPRLRLIALFESEAEVGGLVEALTAAFPGQGGAPSVTILADRVWEREWLTRFEPMRFGERLWVCPGGQRPPAPVDHDPDPIIVELDPGLAFGTGTHQTTAMCLTWLDSRDLAGNHCIDYGCGSGILAIAALKLGATRASAVDIDPQALTATRDNALRNDVADDLSVHLPDDLPANTRAGCVVANILAGELETLAPRLAGLTAPGGALALSGVLADQANAVSAVYATWFEPVSTEHLDEWVLIAMQRRSVS